MIDSITILIFILASLAIAMGAPFNSFNMSRGGGTQSATTLKRQWNSTGHIDKDLTEKVWMNDYLSIYLSIYI